MTTTIDKIIFPDGSEYDGDLENGSPNGEIYEGQWKNNLVDGEGIFKTQNNTSNQGIIYKGQFKDNKFYGKGNVIYNNGSSYKGEYVNNLRQGKGIGNYPNGSLYEGELKNDLPNGKGIGKSPNGTIRVGLFKDSNFIHKCKVTEKIDNHQDTSIKKDNRNIDDLVDFIGIDEQQTKQESPTKHNKKKKGTSESSNKLLEKLSNKDGMSKNKIYLKII